MTRNYPKWASTFMAGSLLVASVGGAVVCAVPSVFHPTIQSAVDDPMCSEIVLANQVFAESVLVGRAVVLRGESSSTTVVEGRITVSGGSTNVEIHDLKVDAGAPAAAGCHPIALEARGGAQVICAGVEVRNRDGDACLIFRDGFESGDESRWSTVVPRTPDPVPCVRSGEERKHEISNDNQVAGHARGGARYGIVGSGR